MESKTRCKRKRQKGLDVQILIVEDDKKLALALKQILVEADYQVDAVHDGQSGLDYGLSGIYDVIILDVMLPKMDGFEVAKELRRNHVDTPILLLTARDTVRDKIVGLDAEKKAEAEERAKQRKQEQRERQVASLATSFTRTAGNQIVRGILGNLFK